MGLECSSIQMEASTKESFATVSKRGMGESCIQTETSTMASGRTTEQMDMAFSKMPLGLDMKVIGRWTSSTVTVRRSSRKKGRFTRATFTKARRTGRERSSGKTAHITKGTSSTESMKDRGSTTLQTRGENTKGSF